ncbi:MAG: RNA polymerase sigma factor [Actinomycetota bacterium]
MKSDEVEGRPLAEAELISDAIDGDVDAFTQLVRTHQATALRVAYLVVRDHDEAADVTQDAFVKAHSALDSFRRDAPFRPWLLRIVRNEALNRVRRRDRQERLHIRVGNEVVSGGAAPSPETAYLEGEQRRHLLDAVETLPRRYRDVISHRYLVGLSEAETADVLDIPVGTVKSRTSRALDRLAKRLEHSGLDSP